MGLKFLCHHCQQPMHVKDFLAGKRGKCPHCGDSIRIPGSGEEYSLPVSIEERATTQERNGVDTSEPATPVISNENLPQSSAATEDSSLPHATNVGSEASLLEPSTTSVALTMPSVIAEALNAAWYVRPQSGGQYGPAVGAVFWEWLKEKRVGESSLVWREGWGNWRTASEVFPDFFASQTTTTGTLAKKSPPPVAPPAKPPKATPTKLGAKEDSVKLEIKASVRNSASTAMVTSVDPNVEGKRNIQMRRKRSSQQNLLLMASLLFLAIVLIGALVAVLWLQSSG